MADGLHNLIGEKTTKIKVGETEYTLSTAVMADHAEKEAYIHSLRPALMSLLSRIPTTLSPRAVQSMQETAFKLAGKSQFVTQDEEIEFDSSPHGIAWRLWRSLRDYHEEFGKGGDPIYQAPNGRSYSVKPADGVQLVLNFMERAGNEATRAIVRAVEEAEEADILPN